MNDPSSLSSARFAAGVGVVEIYPAAPTARRSLSHHVRVLGKPVFVERHASVSYARFAMRGSVTVDIEVASPIAGHSIFPAERVTSTIVSGHVLRLELPTPNGIVVWINELEKLFVLPDPPEADPPIPGSAGVLDATDYRADPTGRSSATTALQAAIDHAADLAGGGTVLLPRGVYRTGTLTLRSNVTLYLARRLAPAGVVRSCRLSDRLGAPRDCGRCEPPSGRPLPRADDDVLAPAARRRSPQRADCRSRDDRRPGDLPPDPPQHRAESPARPREHECRGRGRPVPELGRVVAPRPRLERRQLRERQGDQRPNDPQHGRDRSGHVIRCDDRSVVHPYEGRCHLPEGDAQQRPVRECEASRGHEQSRELTRCGAQGRNRVGSG